MPDGSYAGPELRRLPLGAVSADGMPRAVAPVVPPRPAGAPADARPPRIDPAAEPPDPALIHRYGAARCLEARLMPWRRVGAATVVVTSDLAGLHRHQASLAQVFGPVRIAWAPEAALRSAILRAAAQGLVTEAEARVPLHQSSRAWDMRRARWRVLVFGAVALAALALAPGGVAVALCLWAVAALVVNTALKIAAAIAALRQPPDAAPHLPDAPEALPVVSLMVPLYRETEIAGALLQRLARLDYPADRLDICLILEDDDALTQATIAAAILPRNAQVIAVPQGTIRTKPRALNFALNFARGQIIGIYDAEDAPAPDQIRRIVARFARAGPEVACLQGALDYYNATSNWIARCFTLEYAAWFRLFLPGIARLGLVVPLGGTTLFLRRHAMRVVGGWDAHNVTEDADLGVRLARAGYRTEIIATVTEEEANARAWPWVKQRSRWLKGYMVTWAVHMRDPVALWRDLGAWRFLGFQVLFLGTVTQFLMAPVMWSFWLVALGLPHPLTAILTQVGVLVLAGTFLLAEVINLAFAAVAARRAGKGWLALWAPMLKVYFLLATLAAWIGLIETLTRPHYWHKTAHGVFQPTPRASRRLSRPGATGSQRRG